MSEQIREQVSAFLDGELPNSESELLLKRLTRDGELRDSFGRYALIGESMRGATRVRLTKGFSERVNLAIDGGPAVPLAPQGRSPAPRWWRPFAGAAVAAGVAAVAVVGLQQRAVAPTLRTVPPTIALSSQTSHEPLSYTTPASVADVPTALPAARLTNYVFAHSKYSSVLSHGSAISGLLADGDEETGGSPRAVSEMARPKARPELRVAP